jgi:hypothetical protein
MSIERCIKGLLDCRRRPVCACYCMAEAKARPLVVALFVVLELVEPFVSLGLCVPAFDLAAFLQEAQATRPLFLCAFD